MISFMDDIYMFRNTLRVYKSTIKDRYNSRELKWKELGKDRWPSDHGVPSGAGHQTLYYSRNVGAHRVARRPRAQPTLWLGAHWVARHPTLLFRNFDEFSYSLFNSNSPKIKWFIFQSLRLGYSIIVCKNLLENNFKTPRDYLKNSLKPRQSRLWIKL